MPTEIKNVPDEFKLNVGVSGQVFSEDKKKPAPYFALARADKNYRKSFELAKFAKPAYNKVAAFKNGSEVYESIFDDTTDLVKNKPIAQLISQSHKNTIIDIRPHINIDGWKNPEFNINGLVADLYKGTIKNGLGEKTNQIKKFIKQYNYQFADAKLSLNYSIVFDTTSVGYKLNDIAELTDLINGRLLVGNKLQSIWIVNKDKTVVIKKEATKKAINTLLMSIYKKK